MPRVRAHGGASASHASSHATQIPLNDDVEEKAQRLQNRKALHSRQMSSLKAAATTPQRKRRSMGRADGDPTTPAVDDDDPYAARGGHVTPMQRIPLLANYETWMKMATDNKINATNSWDFALIDYFHDMSLLKEGNGVNFQKASCTLDGCVKIYTSRVDSVATETGKLLSGLADSGNKKRKGGEVEAGAEGEDEEEDEENEDGTRKKGKRKAQRSAEATLATSFDTLKLKKMELEFSVDPLFKKAAADFDEGGAKGLLMNHLSIDSTGRIVFDSSDDAQDAEVEEPRRDSMEPEGEGGDKTTGNVREAAHEDGVVDVSALGAQFFPDLGALDAQDICPSLKTFELGAGGDGSLDLPFLKAPENWRDEHPETEHHEHQGEGTGIDLNGQAAAFGDDDEEGPLDFDMTADVGFGEGGEAWARDAALQPQMRVYDASSGPDAGDDAAAEVGVFDTSGNAYGVTLQHRPHEQENILNYFDNALQKNWAGPEHWKIARIKEANTVKPARTRKEKEPFEIDFAAPMSQELANLLYTSAASNSSISLPKKEWKSKDRNLLPDDKHFNSKDLLQLFLKPKAKVGARRSGHAARAVAPHADVDEAYWATHGADMAERAAHPLGADDRAQGDYDANFFQDDGLPMAGGMEEYDEDFADAREHFSPGAGDAAGPVGAGIDSVAGPNDAGAGAGAFGAHLVAQSRRSRPEYVQYARVAKKVDVRRLKEEMWRGIGFEHRPSTPDPANGRPIPALSLDDQSTLRFTDIMNNLQHVYPERQMSDISTSFGFICLLHLANEKGLVIENVDDWTDLTVRKDFGAIVAEGDI